MNATNNTQRTAQRVPTYTTAQHGVARTEFDETKVQSVEREEEPLGGLTRSKRKPMGNIACCKAIIGSGSVAHSCNALNNRMHSHEKSPPPQKKEDWCVGGRDRAGWEGDMSRERVVGPD